MRSPPVDLGEVFFVVKKWGGTICYRSVLGCRCALAVIDRAARSVPQLETSARLGIDVCVLIALSGIGEGLSKLLAVGVLPGTSGVGFPDLELPLGGEPEGAGLADGLDAV